MSVIRSGNWLSQQRVDVSHLRSIESGVAGDFDVLAGRAWAGQQALVVRGFELTGVVASAQATSLKMSVADGILMNLNATESGSFLWVPADRAVETLDPLANARISGGWIQSATNYVGIDFIRQADSTTTDLVKFEVPETTREIGRQVPLAQTLDYTIVITTVPFGAQTNIVPIAIVTLNASAQITAIQDARPMMFRLGSGGDDPQTQSFFTGWTRSETSGTVDNSIFVGGDKTILSLKDWQNAVMSRLWELGGGANWYSPTADRNVHMVRKPGAGNVFTSGENFWVVSSNLHWKNISFLFDNANTASVYVNEVADQLTTLAGLTDLAVGECIYVDLDRTQNRTGGSALPVTKASLQALGAAAVPGGRFVLAWRTSDAGSVTIYTRDSAYPVGTTIQPATTSSVGGVRLNETPATGPTPTVVTIGVNNAASIGGGAYPISGSNPALTLTGGGSGSGLLSYGGVTNGYGIASYGGGTTGAGSVAAGALGGDGNGYEGLATGTGSGGVFSGGATDGTGVVANAGGTGLAIDAVGGNIALTNTKDYTYKTARTFTYFVPISTFSGDAGNSANFTAGIPGDLLWNNSTTLGTSIAGGMFAIPQGATITGLSVCLQNTSGSNKTFSVDLVTISESGGSTATASLLSGAVAASQVVPTGASAWYSIALGASPIVPTGTGYVSGYIGFPSTGSISQLSFRGMKVTYTMTNLRPV